MKPSFKQRGYTLLEVVLALCILAVSASALSDSISMSVRRSQRAENLARATLLAASIEDRLGREITLDGTRRTGADNDCSWIVTAAEEHRPGDDSRTSARGFQTHISTRCGEGPAARAAELDYFALAGAGA